MANQITIKLIKSPIGRVKRHRACVRGLGLRRMHHQVTVADTPENRGMINKIVDMLAIQES
ncbi:50S ribosomal protein L30 [Salinisphaera sp. T5B8]|uniref:50S ribosomal protein L30 n=1 Tax=unclassified Salinisphaera TaxID=2649847 RepID=UPI003341122E